MTVTNFSSITIGFHMATSFKNIVTPLIFNLPLLLNLRNNLAGKRPMTEKFLATSVHQALGQEFSKAWARFHKEEEQPWRKTVFRWHAISLSVSLFKKFLFQKRIRICGPVSNYCVMDRSIPHHLMKIKILASHK